MKALIVPGRSGTYSIELISESDEERKQLKHVWHKKKLVSIGSEEWREIERKTERGTK
jgi:hypothetical protein